MRVLLPYFEIVSSLVILASPLVILNVKQLPLGSLHVPLVYQKAGDLSVHLIGAATFRLVGLSRFSAMRSRRPRQLLEIGFWLAWLFSAAWAVSVSRAALLAILISAAIVFAMGYARRALLISGSAILAVAVILAALQISIRQGGVREISTNQVIANTISIFSGDSLQNDRQIAVRTLQSNTQWRLRWWSRILEYTVFGDGFWTGRGFGPNLATLDGFQTDQRQTLRSPHSIHMTILARAGVPGLIVWTTLLGAMVFTLFRQERRMRALRLDGWRALNVWIFVYWLAAVVNGSFDVYFEGPQGGIWAWSLMGLGIAAIEIEKRIGADARAPARPLHPNLAQA